MPGRPQLQLLCAQIEKEGGDDVILDRIRNGETIKSISESYGFERTMMYKWRNEGGDERKAAWEQAIKESGDSYVDDAHEIAVDKTPKTSAEARNDLGRAEFFLKLAKLRNPEKFAEKNQGNQTINIQELHLSALQQVSAQQASLPPHVEDTPALPADEDEPLVLEADVVDEEEDEDPFGDLLS